MGVLDIVSRVLTEYKADVSDHKAKIKELTGAEKELAEQELKAAEARNKQHEDWIGKLAKVGLAMDTVARTVKFAFEGLEMYGHKLDLEATAAGVSLDGLSKAAGGVKTKMELLSEAAIFKQSPFKLTQTQMEGLESAMHALEERGRDSHEVMEAFSNFVEKGATRSLEQFGIVIDKTGLAMDENGVKVETMGQRTELFNRAQKGLNDLMREGHDATADQADEITKLTVQWKDMWDELKMGVGKVVVEMKPLLELLLQITGVLGKIAGPLFKDISSNTAWKIDAGFTTGEHIQQAMFFNNLSRAFGSGMKGDLNYQSGQSLIGGFFSGADDQKLKKYTSEELKKQMEEAMKVAALAAAVDVLRSTTTMGRSSSSGNTGYALHGQFLSGQSGGLGAAAGTAVYDDVGNQIDLQSILEGADSVREAAYGKVKKERESGLSKMFGSIEEFTLYKDAFDTLTGSVNSAMQAWITGSESAGAAFKKFIGNAVASLASHMLIESIKFGAYAIASLVPGPFFDPAAAAGYAVTSAEFAAGAGLAAIVARELGAGGSTKGKSGGGKSSGGGSFTGSTGPAQTTSGIIVIGDDFADDSPRMRQLRAKRLVDLATGGRSNVVTDV